jgi:hypothetical protein
MRIEANNASYDMELKITILKLRSRDMTKLANLRRELRGALE